MALLCEQAMGFPSLPQNIIKYHLRCSVRLLFMPLSQDERHQSCDSARYLVYSERINLNQRHIVVITRWPSRAQTMHIHLYLGTGHFI